MITPFDGKRRVCFLAMPMHAGARPEAMKAALSLAASPRTDAFVVDSTNGCLAYNFNSLWAQFINNPGRFDYFCMLHADVQPLCAPGYSWLDALIDELDTGWDVMHAVCMIKDDKGHTSTALGDANRQHQWVRKITAKELQRLPETFGLRDILQTIDEDGLNCDSKPCLLPNTGCMVVRWDPRWRKFPGFAMCDQLAIEMEDGRLVSPTYDFLNKVDDELPEVQGKVIARGISEDWNFGLWCARHGMRVGGTRKVITNHWGVGCFVSAQQWGEERDESYFKLKGIM